MIKRKIIGNLERWKSKADRKPLILRGARQVGKTTAVDMFSKSFDKYVYLNLEKEEDRNIFGRGLPIEKLLQTIFLTKNVTPSENSTLIFIDEIQNSPEAAAILRYFYEAAKEYFVIAAGSLLEAMLSKKHISFPVGRVEYLFMYPLTFEEFLLAMEEKQALEAYNEIPLPEFAMPKLIELFHSYTLIGGMPEIVHKYSEKKDIVSLKSVYQGLLTSYLDDVNKYARNSTMEQVIRHAIETSPLEAGKRIKFHGFGKSNYKSREAGEALRTIERAMLIHLLYPSTVTKLPIIPDLKKSPRLQFVDTGLVNYFAGLQGYFFENKDLHSFYQGILAQHIVGQELIAQDMERPYKPCFWVREQKQSSAEVDFIVPYQQYIIPVEVKAGKTGTLRSLHQFIEQSDCPFGIRLYSGQIEKINTKTPRGKTYTLLSTPYFLTGKIFNYIEWLLNK